MPFTTSDASKKWTSWLTLKRSHSEIANTKRRAGDSSSVPSLDKEDLKFHNPNDDDLQSSPVSVVKLNVVTMMHPSTTVDIPVKPPTPPFAPTTEKDFQRAISEARRYKDACAAAEEAAYKEAQRRFKYYQDMYYVEKAVQRKSAEAQTNLERLTRCARKAGFQVENLSSQTPFGMAPNRDEKLSRDSIDGFITRLGAAGRGL